MPRLSLRPLATFLFIVAACQLRADDTPLPPETFPANDAIIEELVQNAPRPYLDRLDLRNVRPKLRELLQANPILSDPLLSRYKNAENILIGFDAIIAGKPVRLSTLIGPGCETSLSTFEDYVLSVTAIKLIPQPSQGGNLLRLEAEIQLVDLRDGGTRDSRLVVNAVLRRGVPLDLVRTLGTEGSDWLTLDGNQYIPWILW
ncbi:hypothetical protein H5P28_14855 [Ruficoccus amylovorans]|uniref:Uncharacterized protein n=1 Tax=Ruficoccus amylovorans TaxID=1804625 RepID=A0A842HIW8_9BACT|nr:hypothetical protein [Ruficoccus amylovorans]MBC2595544.1 hypothetical protein [Ruficoccus amylovorans]